MKKTNIHPQEVQRILSNTRTYKTTTKEIVALHDLFYGLMASDYTYSPYHSSEKENVPHMVMETKDAKKALDEICGVSNLVLGSCCTIGEIFNDMVFNMRISHASYDGGKLGYNPSSLLTSQDLLDNPSTFSLILAQLTRNYDTVHMDEKAEIKVMGRGNERDARRLAARLDNLYTNYEDHTNQVRYNKNRILTPAASLKVEFPLVYVDETPMFMLRTVSHNERMIDELIEKMTTLKSPKTKGLLAYGIKLHTGWIKEGREEHYVVCQILPGSQFL